MSDETTPGASEETIKTAQDAGSKSDGHAAELAKVRDEAAKNRIGKREATERASDLEGQLAALQKQQTAILKAAGLADENEDGSADLEAIERKAKEREQKAQAAIIRAEAKAKALELGVRPDRVDQALKLADFGSVDADLETLEVTGVTEAMTAVLEGMPELKAHDPKAAGVENRIPGSPKGGIDPSNLKVGDVNAMSSDEFTDFLKSNPVIPTGRYVTNAEGEMVPEVWQNGIGGNSLDKSLRRARRDAESQQKALGDI